MADEKELAFTGERLMTGIYEYWSIEHLHRYALASEMVKGKRIIDIASGEGYGSNLLADVADSVVGIDISKDAVAHAQKKYKKENLRFVEGSATAIPIDDKSIDAVVSFETIEHHDQHEKMLLEIKRVLKPDGILIISSPDKKYYTDEPGYNNPYHVKELYSYEFKALVQSHFSNVLFLNQKTIFGSVIVDDDGKIDSLKEYTGDYNGTARKEALHSAVYNVCIASDIASQLNTTVRGSIFSNKDMFEKYTGLKEENDRLITDNHALRMKYSHPVYRAASLFLKPFEIFSKK